MQDVDKIVNILLSILSTLLYLWIMKKTFGQNLKKLRQEKNISQRQLAEKVGVDFSYISKIENDRLPPPAADTIIKICAVLGVSSEEFLAHSGKIGSDIKENVLSNPSALKFLNQINEMGLTEDEWDSLFKKLKQLR